MPIRVAIVGAGIAGLTTAISLFHSLRSDAYNYVEVNIYERSAELTEVGAGIIVWPRVWSVLETIGLAQKLSKHYIKGTDTDMNHRRHGKELFKTDYDSWIGGGSRAFHRADFHSVLRSCIPEQRCKIHLSKRLVKYTKDSSVVHLEFMDNSSAECDILIGADGVHSLVRKSMLGNNAGAEPLYSGFSTYRAMVDPIDVPENHYSRTEMSLTIANAVVCLQLSPVCFAFHRLILRALYRTR
jgi:salicylate hydroxylase